MTVRRDHVTRIVGGGTHLADVTLDLATGPSPTRPEDYALLGPSGCGKTTQLDSETVPYDGLLQAWKEGRVR